MKFFKFQNIYVVALLSLAALSIPYAKAQLQSQLQTPSSFNSASRFPPPEEVFILDYQQIDHELTITMEIPEGFYLYQERFDVTPANKVATEIELPEGIPYQDQFFGDTVIYRNQVSFSVQLNAARRNEPLTLHYQGCADEGFCYPPSTQTIFLRQTDGLNGRSEGQNTASNATASKTKWVTFLSLLGALAFLILRKKRSNRN